MSKPQRSILVATIFGVFLIVSAYILGANTTPEKDTALTQKVGREFVKPEDKDGNGVPDWQDNLLGDDAIVIEDAASSTYKKPTTVTGRFGVSFFEDMLRSKMYGVFGKSNEELAASSAEKLRREAVDELFGEEDIERFDTIDPLVLKAYGNQVATILTSHPQSGDSELFILQEYLRYENDETLKKLEPIALAYTTMVKDLLEMQVPTKYTKQHLDLLNALNAVREDIRGMQKVEEDAMYSLLRTKRYEDDVMGMGNAIKNLFNTLYLSDNIRWEEGESVLRLMVFPSS
jgi:hypothetical protein